MSGLKRALIITTVSGFVPQFEMNNVRLLQEMGYEVHYASNFHNPHYGSDNHRLKGTGICCHQIDFVRSPWKAGANLTAFRQLCRLLQKYPFQLVHCHTPMGGVLGRLAVKWVEHIQKNKQNGQKSVQKTEQRRQNSAQKSRQQRQDSIQKNRQKEQNSTPKSGQEQQEHIQQDRPFIKKEKRPKKSKFIKLKIIKPKVLKSKFIKLKVINPRVLKSKFIKFRVLKPQFITPRVIYTAHGFHFYKGAPLHNWLLYYPVEWWLARFTDTLITINKEDYQRAKKFRLKKNGIAAKVNGVGINLEEYQNISTDRKTSINRETKRKELGVREEDFLLLSVGELSKRKNHKVVMEALDKLIHEKKAGNTQKIKYLIAGEGQERRKLERLIHKKQLENNITLLGYRADVKELLAAADCFVFPSLQEGMPVALLEAAAAGLPCIASDIRGSRDLIKKSCLFKIKEVGRLQTLLDYAVKKELPSTLKTSPEKLKAFDISQVSKTMKRLYQTYL